MPFGVSGKTIRIVAATMPMLIASCYAVAATDAPSISGLSRPRFCSAFNIPASAQKLDDRIYRIIPVSIE
jgi:hypothetical protein